jgi:hypothetical protein
MLGGLAALLCLAGCGPSPAGAPDDPAAAAAQVVRDFFAGYRGDFRQADPALLSAGLTTALQSAAAGEKASAARVKASAFPNDKPQLLEGEIFSGLYEGFTAFEVGPVRAADGTAAVEVRFRNEPYNVAWTDEVLLVDEDGWKIDDVRYTDKKAGLLSLRQVLQDFESVVAAEAAALSKKP